jgi:hypothetical protein
MLKKILFRPGVNRENTRYASEALGSINAGAMTTGGWYSSDKVRFRAGTPEKLGGWERISDNTYLGVCRSLWNWVTLAANNLLGVGTNLKFYIETGGAYIDITPIRVTTAAGDVTFAAVTTAPFSSTITVTDTAHGATAGSSVTYSGAASLGGNITAAVLNQEYQIATIIDANSYTITAKNTVGVTVTSNASDVGNGGGATVGTYQVNAGSEIQVPLVGWGAGFWGAGTWGVGTTSSTNAPLRIWNQMNFGQDLIFGPRGGGLYYWDAALGFAVRGENILDLVDPSETNAPQFQNYLLVSDSSRFVIVFGTNDYSASTLDPMLVRWSDQENPLIWTPAATNQAGSLKLSHGSGIVTAIQSRQEVVIFTDSAVYSMQYQGPPAVWGSQLLGDNISIVGPNAVSLASGVVYWMGVDKFYKYDGRVQTLRCDLRQYIFSDINVNQNQQIFSGTNEGFNEVWWFYCSSASDAVDKYVIYNYGEDIWYYGTLARTAWVDSGLRPYPMAATYVNNVVYHENGVDDNATQVTLPIEAFISSSEFDIDDGHNFGFVYRVLPDLTFRGSTGTETPQVTMTLIPLANSGSGYNNPQSEGGSSTANIQRIATAPIEEFTGQVFIRVRGRQMTFRIDSTQIGTQWQLGAPRIDIRQDGRRGNS